MLNLFNREVEDVRSFLLGMDMVYVGGGSIANLLTVWRLHGIDVALREAWAGGVVMAGLSAGGSCWFESSTTDSFLIGKADAYTDGLGLVPGSFCPHYTSEPERRPNYLEMVGAGRLPDGYACEDGTAVHLADAQLLTAISVDGDATAFRVVQVDGRPVETELEATTPS